jgi:hypothetical protein
MSVSTLAQSKAMAPEARREWMDMSSSARPYWAPSAATVVRMCFVKAVVVNVLQGGLWHKVGYPRALLTGTRCHRPVRVERPAVTEVKAETIEEVSVRAPVVGVFKDNCVLCGTNFG